LTEKKNEQKQGKKLLAKRREHDRTYLECRIICVVGGGTRRLGGGVGGDSDVLCGVRLYNDVRFGYALRRNTVSRHMTLHYIKYTK
jgi:hypothetical protein